MENMVRYKPWHRRWQSIPSGSTKITPSVALLYLKLGNIDLLDQYSLKQSQEYFQRQPTPSISNWLHWVKNRIQDAVFMIKHKLKTKTKPLHTFSQSIIDSNGNKKPSGPLLGLAGSLPLNHNKNQICLNL